MAPRLLTVLVLTGVLQVVVAAAPGPAETGAPSELLHAAAAPARGYLFDREMAAVSDRAFAERASSAQFVLLGADHRNPCDLAVQTRLLDAWGQAETKPVLGLETVGVDQQGVLDLFNAGRIPAERLGDALNWQQNWGVEFQQYLPAFQRARATGMAVVGLNIPPYAAFLAAEGRLDPEVVRPRSLLPPVLPPMPRGDVPWLQDAQDEEAQFVAPFTPTVRSPVDLQYLHFLRNSQMAFVAQEEAKRYEQPHFLSMFSFEVKLTESKQDDCRTSYQPIEEKIVVGICQMILQKLSDERMCILRTLGVVVNQHSAILCG